MLTVKQQKLTAKHAYSKNKHPYFCNNINAFRLLVRAVEERLTHPVVMHPFHKWTLSP